MFTQGKRTARSILDERCGRMTRLLRDLSPDAAWRNHSPASERVAREGIRFMLVGAAATLVSTTAFNLLVHGPSGSSALSDRPLTAFALANLVGMVVSYSGTRVWAFRGRTAVGVGQGLPAFIAINLVSWTVPLTCLAITRYVFGLDDPVADNLSANVVGLGLGMAVRFWALRRAVFIEPGRALPSAALPHPRGSLTTEDEGIAATDRGARRACLASTSSSSR